MRCETPESFDPNPQPDHSLGTIYLRPPHIKSTLSSLCASHELLMTRRYHHASIPPSSFTSCLVLVTTNTAISHRPPAYLYLYISFSPTPFGSHSRLEDIGWRVYWLGFAPRPVSLHASTAQLRLVGHLAISRLLETTPTQSKFGDLNVEIPHVFYSAVLLFTTDTLPFSFAGLDLPHLFTFPIPFSKTYILASK